MRFTKIKVNDEGVELAWTIGQTAFVYAKVASVSVPDFGNYEWVFSVDGVRVGEITIALLDPATMPKA